jgi:transcriptional regulator with XRE-family HTH domain
LRKEYPVIDMLKTGRNIKRIMRIKGFTVKDVQDYLHLGAPQAIYHWFVGKSMPTLDNLYALSDLFSLPIDIILVGNRKSVFVPFADVSCRRLYTYYINMVCMVE